MQECKVEMKRIMAALDLSSYSESTFAHALTLARAFKAELILLNVINTRGLQQLSRFEAMGYDISEDKYITLVKEERRETFQKEYLSRVGDVPARLVFRAGNPWEEILDAIKKEKADLLVMGTKGHGGVAHILLGTVAERVFHRATCPVVSVRGPEHCKDAGH
jgi:nucleotide-binding universal stress UspA family protein